MWLHNEQREISDFEATHAKIQCTHCKRVVRKYVDTWYGGGSPCVIKAEYCGWCHKPLYSD